MPETSDSVATQRLLQSRVWFYGINTPHEYIQPELIQEAQEDSMTCRDTHTSPPQ